MWMTFSITVENSSYYNYDWLEKILIHTFSGMNTHVLCMMLAYIRYFQYQLRAVYNVQLIRIAIIIITLIYTHTYSLIWMYVYYV